MCTPLRPFPAPRFIQCAPLRFLRRGLSNAPRRVDHAARRRFSAAPPFPRGNILLLYHKSSLCQSPIFRGRVLPAAEHPLCRRISLKSPNTCQRKEGKPGGLAFFNYGIRACDRAASPPGPSEIQSWAFRNSRSEMPAKREYYHSSLFFACISPTAPQAMTPRRMAASTTKTMICQSGMRYPITSPFMALELASE